MSLFSMQRACVWVRRVSFACVASLVLGGSASRSAEGADSLLAELSQACAVLDEVHIEWTEITRRTADASVVALWSHALWSHGGRALHMRWKAEGESWASTLRTDLPTEEDWLRLDGLARVSAPSLDLWDGVRHTRYSRQRDSKSYVVSALRAKEGHRFCAQHLYGFLYYADFRIDGLGAGWERVSSQGADGSRRRGYCAPNACFYLAFGPESALPRWSLLWNESWTSAQSALDGSPSIGSLGTDARLVTADEVLQWAEPIKGLPRLPLLARHLRPHVKETVLSHLRLARPLSGDVDPLEAPAGLEGAQQVYWDEITNEGLVIDASGQRRPLYPRGGLGGGGTRPPPPPPLIPAESQRPVQENQDASWRVPTLIVGAAMVAVAILLQLRARRRGQGPNPL